MRLPHAQRRRQVANRAQMSNVRKNNREVLRNYRTPSKIKRRSGSSTRSTPDSAREKSLTPTKQGCDGDSNEITAMSSSMAEENKITISNSSAAAMVVERPYSSFENAPPTPVWEATDAEGSINSELVSTYRRPRLYLRDPSQIIMENAEIATGSGNNQHNNDGGPWWFRLAQQMETTLKHVQDDHWTALSEQSQHSRRITGGHAISHSDSISVASSHQPHAFRCAGLEVPNADSDGCVDMCLGKPQDQQQRHQQTTSQPKAKKGRSTRYRSKSPLSSSSNSKSSGSKRRPRKGASTGSSPSTGAASKSQPPAAPVNAWSEPCASTLKVRGPTYSRDGIKVESAPSLFSVVGVDSFVKPGFCGKGDGGDADEGDDLPSDGAEGYLRRWTRACEGMGLDPVPFLLIINFIVPWGNFQAYFARPDADEGPFSSRHKHTPSEKAWRGFMEGTTEYRNKRLKLIPRVCAGPWMVKRMVGSTPAIVGAKLPVSYRGSVRENFLAIDLDVTGGPAFGNSVANTVVGRADAVAIDLGFVVEGREEEGHLPERMLGLVRLHHLDMKGAPTRSRWKEELLHRHR